MTKWWIGLLAATVGLLAGCGNGERQVGGDPSTKRPTNGSAGKAVKVGVVFDSGGRGDKSFNDSAFAGAERAQKELGVEVRYVESKSEKDYETNLTALADQNFDIVFAIGLGMKTALEKLAPSHPNVKFAIVDADVSAPNVRSLLFKEEEGSFLAGSLAALVTKTNKIGFVGGKEIPLIQKFLAGYIAGAMVVNPNIEVLPPKYTQSWDDVPLGKASASVLFGQGADIVYHAAGRAGLGVIDAAKESGKLAIGVDGNQDDIAPGFVLTSMVKRVDNAVFATVKDLEEGRFTGGVTVYDLKAGGVGLTDMKYTQDKIPAGAMDKVNALKKQIEDGTIKVPTKPEDVPAFLQSMKK